MNMQKILVFGGIAAIGYLAYRQFFGTQGGNLSVSPYSYPNNAYASSTLGGQPSQQYPYTAVTPPRTDNTSQPWTATQAQTPAPSNVASYTGGLVDANFAANVQYLKGGADIVNSLTSVWDDIGSWWSDDTAAFGEDWV